MWRRQNLMIIYPIVIPHTKFMLNRNTKYILIKHCMVIHNSTRQSFWYRIVWGLVIVVLIENGVKSSSNILLQCKFFAADALERKYCHHCGPNQRHRSITQLSTFLAGAFQRNRVYKIPSASYIVRLLYPWCKQCVQLFNMAIIFWRS